MLCDSCKHFAIDPSCVAFLKFRNRFTIRPYGVRQYLLSQSGIRSSREDPGRDSEISEKTVRFGVAE